MSLTIAILAHHHLNRVERLVNILSDQNVNICIHVDSDASSTKFRQLHSTFSSGKNVHFVKRISCDWGDFSLVDAELRMCTDILKKWPDTTHVQLISGDSLPVKPMNALQNMLAVNQDVDFIESVAVGDDNWIAGGLGIERFTLHFPFSWKTERRRFDAAVSIQRKLGIKRRMPKGLKPFIGSQWWCLTRETIQAILDDPDKTTYDAYFNKCWIPDESYFQTLVRKYARKIQSRSLMYYHFDHQGKPTTIYDDHCDILGGVDEFFARKIWPGANELYRTCASGFNGGSGALANQIKLADDRRKTGRQGLRMQGRAPNKWHEKQRATAAPYFVFSGVSTAIPTFDDWLEIKIDDRPQGRLFATDAAYFKGNTKTGPGGLSANATIRDSAPEDFLGNLSWQSRDKKLAFHFEMDDQQRIGTYLANDPNANIYYVRHGWVLSMMSENINNHILLQAKAAQFLANEHAFLSKIQSASEANSANIWTLGEVLSDPASVLSTILKDLEYSGVIAPMILPEIANAGKTIEFARKLKDIGINIDMAMIEANHVNMQQNSQIIINR